MMHNYYNSKQAYGSFWASLLFRKYTYTSPPSSWLYIIIIEWCLSEKKRRKNYFCVRSKLFLLFFHSLALFSPFYGYIMHSLFYFWIWPIYENLGLVFPTNTNQTRDLCSENNVVLPKKLFIGIIFCFAFLKAVKWCRWFIWYSIDQISQRSWV